jgi:hypothetical protein
MGEVKRNEGGQSTTRLAEGEERGENSGEEDKCCWQGEDGGLAPENHKRCINTLFNFIEPV